MTRAVQADIAGVAAAMGDPSSAVLLALAGGQALTAAALAAEAGVRPSALSNCPNPLWALIYPGERLPNHHAYQICTSSLQNHVVRKTGGC